MTNCDLCKKKLKTIFHGDEIQIHTDYHYFACMDCIKWLRERGLIDYACGDLE